MAFALAHLQWRYGLIDDIIYIYKNIFKEDYRNSIKYHV